MTVGVGKVKELHAQGLSDAEIARRLGASYKTVRAIRSETLHLPANKRQPKKRYTVYHRETGDLLASGSARECAEQLGIERGSFYNTVSRLPKREAARYKIFVEELTEEE